VNPIVNLEIPRFEPHIADALAGQGVATVHEAIQRRGLLDPRLRPINPGWSICGPAVTSLNHPGDSLMVHAALAVCEPGDVLVIATTVPCDCGLVGELLARQAKVHQLSAIIVDSGIRDLADLRALGLPIWSSSVTAAGSVKATPGWVNVPIVCGGTTIHPGDAIVADEDGVVAVPNAEV
jgi:4-hydroxy-4-methyl-2-oxoglutarate aldolase